MFNAKASAGKRYFSHSKLCDIVDTYPYPSGIEDGEKLLEERQVSPGWLLIYVQDPQRLLASLGKGMSAAHLDAISGCWSVQATQGQDLACTRPPSLICLSLRLAVSSCSCPPPAVSEQDGCHKLMRPGMDMWANFWCNKPRCCCTAGGCFQGWPGVPWPGQRDVVPSCSALELQAGFNEQAAASQDHVVAASRTADRVGCALQHEPQWTGLLWTQQVCT